MSYRSHAKIQRRMESNMKRFAVTVIQKTGDVVTGKFRGREVEVERNLRMKQKSVKAVTKVKGYKAGSVLIIFVFLTLKHVKLTLVAWNSTALTWWS